MKRKIYFMIMLVTCLSIATPALASPMFGDTVELVGEVYEGEDGNCYRKRVIVSHFFWFRGEATPTDPIEVSCVQISEKSLNEFRD